MWDATFFCGSCAVIRRKPLDEIGGIAVEMITEDAHTSLRPCTVAYTSAYMRIPQAARSGDGIPVGAYRPAYSLGAQDGTDFPS